MSGSGGARLRRAGDGIAEVTLDRPDAMNSLSTGMLKELTSHFTALAADQETAVVVLSAAGERAFCAGADLKERAGMSDDQFMAQRPAFRSAFSALLGLPQPVIAAVQGFALGGGCELALSCDVIVADRDAVLGLPEVTVGLVPGCGGTQLLARRIGPGRAAELIFSGRKIDAAQALAIGLVDRLAERGTARSVALELAGQIAANSPVAVRAAKRSLRNGAGLALAAALDVEDAAWRTAAASADRREGITAFVQKRKPAWPLAAAGSGPAGPGPAGAGPGLGLADPGLGLGGGLAEPGLGPEPEPEPGSWPVEPAGSGPASGQERWSAGV